MRGYREGVHQSLAGRLLVSRPELHDPNFDGTITLLLEHDQNGAFGLTLNRPTGTACVDLLPRWAGLISDPAVIFSGGPVQPGAIIALSQQRSADRADVPEGIGEGEAGDAGTGRLPLGLVSVDLDSQPELLGAEIADLRLFSGYAGWGSGQLEGELAMQAWWVTDATIDDVFCGEPRGLWARVLRRSGGDLQWYAHLPDDPSLN